MKDIVVGCITNYNFDKIKYWVNSLDRSGFDGVKILLCYNIAFEVAEELAKRGYTIFAFGQDKESGNLTYKHPNDRPFNICLDRFAHIPFFLNRLENKEQYRYIISTDVKDVVFQTNPSEWLESNIGDKKLNVACESIRYKDEDWGRNNMQLSFGPLIYDRMKDNPIYNAGTISGEFTTMLDFMTNVFLSCGGAPANVPGGGGPDQAAINVLLDIKPYKDITNFAMSEDGYAAQLGTTGPQISAKYGQHLVEPAPIMVDDMVCTSQGKPFAMVHQYDRVPEWKQIIEKKYA